VTRKSDSSLSQLDLFIGAPAKDAKTPAEKPFVLNPRQREAVEHVHGPMLVVAGAGTGKTTVLAHRIARLIRDGAARPEEILAVTYTENAAAELAGRVAKEVGANRSAGLKAKTFHAYCYGLLVRCHKEFRVVEKEDLWVYLRRRLPDLHLQYYTRAASPAQFLEALLDFFDNCHDELKTADDYSNYVAELAAGQHPLPRVTKNKKDVDGLSPADVLGRCREISRVFRQVEDMLQAEGWGTFGHMILRATQLLNSEPSILAKERQEARFTLIDEFQDSNIAQIQLAQLLAGPEQNIFAVGDPDQAIYRFRGASSAAFDEFIARFPKTKSVVLDRNLRSTSAILNCAHAVIAHNPAVTCRLGRSGQRFDRQSLISERELRAKADAKLLQTHPVDLVMPSGNSEEACDIATAIGRKLSELQWAEGESGGKKSPSLAVLYRSHANRNALVKELASRKIPFRVEGLNAMQTAEVRDVMAGLRSFSVPPETDSLFRVAAMPIFQLDPERVREQLRAGGREVDLASVLVQVPGGDSVLATVDNARAEAAAAGWKMEAVFEIVIKRFGIDPVAPPVVAFREFLKKWVAKPITVAGTLPEFLEYMDYFPEAGGCIPFQHPEQLGEASAVTLMTVHAAKGLEFDQVFIIRATGGSFPANYRERLFELPLPLRDPHCLAVNDGPELHKQEERRLFYVAMTRTRDLLTIYARRRGTKNPQPNAFVRELVEARILPPSWRERNPDVTVDVNASVETQPNSGLGGWFLGPPSARLLTSSLSASAVETYENCPLQFKLRREWNIPGNVAAALHFGAAVHDTLRDYFEVARVGRPRSQEELLSMFDIALAERHFDDEHQRDLYRAQGKIQLERFFQVQSRRPAPDVFSTEGEFELQIQGIRIRGRIDRMDRIGAERVSVIDYKTGAPRSEIDARKSLQLSIYALAALERWKLHPERLVFYNLETNEEVVTSRTEKELNVAKERIRRVAENIAQGHFDPTPGFQCRSCPYCAMCPATEERLYPINQARSANVN